MTKETRLFTREEVKSHGRDLETNLFIINNKVYDVSKFLNDHPGGEEVLVEQRGKDASEPFDDVSHSKDAIELMENYFIGEIVESERIKVVGDNKSGWQQDNNEKNNNKQRQSSSSDLPYGLIIVALIAVIVAVNYGIFS